MIHEHGYFLTDCESIHGFWDESIVKSILDLFDIVTVADIGCGNGSYTEQFINNGILCTGFDGCPLTPEMTNGLCHVKDFSQFVDIGKFDLVLSLEVGEHIPRKFEQVFIDNVCNASEKYIVLSWAVENQKGDGHVNCRSNDYVIAEIEKRGFKYDEDSTQYIRDRTSNETMRHFCNTIMVFTK